MLSVWNVDVYHMARHYRYLEDITEAIIKWVIHFYMGPRAMSINGAVLGYVTAGRT